MESIKIKLFLLPCLILFLALSFSNLANAQTPAGPEEQVPSTTMPPFPPDRERIRPAPPPGEIEPPFAPEPGRRDRPVPPKREFQGERRELPSKPGGLERTVRDLERRVRILEQKINQLSGGQQPARISPRPPMRPEEKPERVLPRRPLPPEHREKRALPEEKPKEVPTEER